MPPAQAWSCCGSWCFFHAPTSLTQAGAQDYCPSHPGLFTLLVLGFGLCLKPFPWCLLSNVFFWGLDITNRSALQKGTLKENPRTSEFRINVCKQIALSCRLYPGLQWGETSWFRSDLPACKGMQHVITTFLLKATGVCEVPYLYVYGQR